MAGTTGNKKRKAGTRAANVAATAQAEPSTNDIAASVLVSLAEELGRLSARRALAETRARRGYSLVELIVGALVVATADVLAVRLLGWLLR